MRRFKHKPTGEVATLRNNYYVCKDSACIPIRFIEDSCDWEEVVEKHIKFNKPQYSIKDIVSVVNNWSMCGIDEDDILNFLAKNEK